MTLSESALCELLDAFRAGVGVDLIRDAVGLVLQKLIELEVADRIGAAGYERSESRVSERNGSGPRGVVDPGRGCAAAHSEVAEGLVLLGHPRAAPPHRSGTVRGGDGGLPARHFQPCDETAGA
jgi:hypothetical protein